MNDNILYHALATRPRATRPEPPSGATTRRPPEKGGAKKSRTMMSREWVKDTREAWERAGQGERIDRHSLAERRDEAERAGDLEREGRGEKKRGFGCGPTGWSRTIRRFGRSGTASSSGSRRGSRGSIGSWRNRPAATTVQPEHGPQPQLALVYRIQQAPGHFMDNEDTRVPTVHIESGGPIIDDTQLEHWGRSHGQYRPDSSWRTLGGVSRRTRNQPIPLGES